MNIFKRIWAWVKGLFHSAEHDVVNVVDDVKSEAEKIGDKTVAVARDVTADAKADVATAANAGAGAATDVAKKAD